MINARISLASANAVPATAWMDQTFPLHADFIESAVASYAARRADAFEAWEKSAAANPSHDHVIGPIYGGYIATYACRVGDLGDQYVSSYKICRTRPDSFMTANAAVQGECGEMQASGEAAIKAAEGAALVRICNSEHGLQRRAC